MPCRISGFRIAALGGVRNDDQFFRVIETRENTMSPFNSAYLEHQLKRWMRPDAHNFIHPDWRRDVKPGSELWALYERYERKYSPSQPRDDRGRWTSDGGTQLAQNDRSGYPVDLREERQLGGHTIEEHVAKSEGYLLNRVQQQALSTTRRGEYSNGLRVGSFTSLEAANKLVNSTLAQNKAQVDSVATGASPREQIDAQFSSPTGYEAYARTERSQAYIRDTNGVRVIIVRDRNSAKGFRVDTAYPRNFDR